MITEIRAPNNILNYFMMIAIFFVCVYQSYEKNIYKSLQETYHLIILCLMFLIMCSLIYKFRLFLEELFYINVDYNGDILSVIKATLSFNTPSQITFAVTIFSFVMLIVTLNYEIFRVIQLNLVTTACTLGFSLLLLYSVDILDCRASQVLRVFSSGGLDPGTAMASSYFYGYLKIILPSSGGLERVGILTALEKYEAIHKVNVPVKKLFILIPSSSYIPPDLREASNNWMEHSGNLETITTDRAGVKSRTYHNTIYKVRPEGPDKMSPNSKFVYLAVEGATPLKTFLEVQDQSHRYAPMYKKYNKEVIRNFYTTLKIC